MVCMCLTHRTFDHSLLGGNGGTKRSLVMTTALSYKTVTKIWDENTDVNFQSLFEQIDDLHQVVYEIKVGFDKHLSDIKAAIDESNRILELILAKPTPSHVKEEGKEEGSGGGGGCGFKPNHGKEEKETAEKAPEADGDCGCSSETAEIASDYSLLDEDSSNFDPHQ